jgi:hypothetical protein
VSDINESVIVKCPPERAQKYLLEHFKKSADSSGEAMLRLTATVGPEGGSHVTVTRDATATFAPTSGAGGLEYQVLIDWAPASKEPLPKFSGVFRVQWEEDYGSCRLVLEGQYDPPLGLVGKAFDAVLGHRIAHRTVTAMLDQLRLEIEAAHRKDSGTA